jgi:hypothetical protein
MKGNSLAYNGVSVNVAEALKGGGDSEQASSITLKRVSSLSISPNILSSLFNCDPSTAACSAMSWLWEVLRSWQNLFCSYRFLDKTYSYL